MVINHMIEMRDLPQDEQAAIAAIMAMVSGSLSPLGMTLLSKFIIETVEKAKKIAEE